MGLTRVAAGLSLAATMVLVSPALAQDGSPAPGDSTEPVVEGPWTVVASGLDAPSRLLFTSDGTLYVSEQGRGGDACFEGDPQEGGGGCVGPTGGVSTVTGLSTDPGVVTPGTVTRVIDGLPSLVGQEGAGGISDFTVAADGTIAVLLGLGGGPDARAGYPAPFNTFLGDLATAAADGTLTPIADLAQWEADNNPDAADPGSAVDSNPYGMTLAPDGGYLVVDAGGNDLLMVAPDGTVTLGAVFPAQFVPAPPDPTVSPAPDPAASPALMPMQAVPTSVVVGPDGAAYVSQLTGFPFPAGGAVIWRVEAGKEPTVYASGLTNVIDLAFAPDGTLFVLEFAHGGLLAGPPAGAVLSIPAGGGPPELVTDLGLRTPGGMRSMPKDRCTSRTTRSHPVQGPSRCSKADRHHDVSDGRRWLRQSSDVRTLSRMRRCRFDASPAASRGRARVRAPTPGQEVTHGSTDRGCRAHDRHDAGGRCAGACPGHQPRGGGRLDHGGLGAQLASRPGLRAGWHAVCRPGGRRR